MTWEINNFEAPDGERDLTFGASFFEGRRRTMTNDRMDPRKQFSKKLARWTAVFWFLYMTWLSVIILLQPSTGLFAVYLAIIVTIVMVLNIWTYMKNSIAEKMIFGIIDKTKLQLGVGNKGTSSMDGSCETDNEEVESNG